MAKTEKTAKAVSEEIRVVILVSNRLTFAFRPRRALEPGLSRIWLLMAILLARAWPRARELSARGNPGSYADFVSSLICPHALIHLGNFMQACAGAGSAKM